MLALDRVCLGKTADGPVVRLGTAGSKIDLGGRSLDGAGYPFTRVVHRGDGVAPVLVKTAGVAEA